MFQDTLLPSYVILPAEPEKIERGTIGLEPGECVDVCTGIASQDKPQELHLYIYRIANVDGQAQETLLEHFMLEK